MPFPGGDQVVFLHALVRLGKTRYQSNNIELRLEVISRAFKLVTLVHMNDIVPCKSQAHLFIKSVYATQDLK